MIDVVNVNITSTSDGESSFSVAVVTLMDDEGDVGEQAHVTVTPYPLNDEQVLEIVRVIKR